jgi:hypothetical protein
MRPVGMPTEGCSCAQADEAAQRHAAASTRAERGRFMAYLIVVRGAGGSVNESGGEGEGVVKRDAKQAIPG